MNTISELASNPFETKSDYTNAYLSLIKPLRQYYAEDRPGELKLGSSGSIYCEKTRRIEAFLRPLWGLGPYLMENQDDILLKTYMEGIIAGTDPKNPHYWGDITDRDQLMVEMASLSNMLLLVKEKTWDILTKEQQDNLYNWLYQINTKETVRNNWVFFRILVNLAIKHCEREWSKESVDNDLKTVDSFYLGNGWYNDGVTTQLDYYISWGIHYYSLLYCKYMKDEDKERVAVLKDRATQFAQTFKYWFDAKGEALPFGRSLTYKFAQISLWSAYVFADVEALPWGEIKGIISRNLKQWFNREIFNSDGVLSIGYHYQNLVMGEGYNAPGSPYWAFKMFILLAVPKDHPFWKTPSQPLKLEKEKIAVSEGRMLLTHTKNDTQLQAFPAGQYCMYAHGESKYSKFVYSTTFGFSVAKGNSLYIQGGFDNCLALSESDKFFRTKCESEKFIIKDDFVESVWFPWNDVKINTKVVPLANGWHIRIHHIESSRDLIGMEGGFSTPMEKNVETSVTNMTASYGNSVGLSYIAGIAGYESASIVNPAANTSLFFQLTSYPCLKAQIKRGNTLLISLVGGVEKGNIERVPEVTFENNTLKVVEDGTSYFISIETTL